MHDNDTSRLSRLTAILNQLQSKRMVTATSLAETFGVSVRTIYRDIRALPESTTANCSFTNTKNTLNWQKK